jgi:hypothetical protein
LSTTTLKKKKKIPILREMIRNSDDLAQPRECYSHGELWRSAS